MKRAWALSFPFFVFFFTPVRACVLSRWGNETVAAVSRFKTSPWKGRMVAHLSNSPDFVHAPFEKIMAEHELRDVRDHPPLAIALLELSYL